MLSTFGRPDRNVVCHLDWHPDLGQVRDTQRVPDALKVHPQLTKILLSLLLADRVTLTLRRLVELGDEP